MPLSEDEKRILSEIEEQFYASDPAFAREVGSRTLYGSTGRRMVWAGATMALGGLLLVLTYARSPVLGALCFVMMLCSCFVLEANHRRRRPQGLSKVSDGRSGEQVKDYLGEAAKRLRGRFNRE